VREKVVRLAAQVGHGCWELTKRAAGSVRAAASAVWASRELSAPVLPEAAFAKSTPAPAPSVQAPVIKTPVQTPVAPAAAQAPVIQVPMPTPVQTPVAPATQGSLTAGNGTGHGTDLGRALPLAGQKERFF
jgi:hypothetical protein